MPSIKEHFLEVFANNKVRAASLFAAVVIVAAIAVVFVMKDEVQEEQAEQAETSRQC